MPDRVKEKLVELVDDYTNHLTVRDIHKADFSEKFADQLIANGVTVQEWISSSKPPQTGGEYLCRCIVNDMDDLPFYMVLRYYIVDENPHFQHEQKGGMKVTHWREFGKLEKPEPREMPQPPKGE